MNLRWPGIVFIIELRKSLAYRLDFWVKFFGSIAVHICVAYFLWKAVYTSSGQTQIGGYTFEAMMMYAVLVSFVERMTVNVDGASRGILSTEIYDGGLTRYLIYPVPVLGYKYISFFANCVPIAFQLVLSVAVISMFFDLPPDASIRLSQLALGLVATVLGGAMYFLLLCLFDMVAFWADGIWSLTVMLRFAVMFSGGGVLALSLLPEGLQTILRASPFSYVFAVPLELFLGRISAAQWFALLPAYCGWMLLFYVIVRFVWSRGTREYSGIGL